MTTRRERELQVAEDRAFRQLQREILILEREVKRLEVKRKKLEVSVLIATVVVLAFSLSLAHPGAAVELGLFLQLRG